MIPSVFQIFINIFNSTIMASGNSSYTNPDPYTSIPDYTHSYVSNQTSDDQRCKNYYTSGERNRPKSNGRRVSFNEKPSYDDDKK